MKRFYCVYCSFLLCSYLFCQIPQDYYRGADGLCDSTLKTALHGILNADSVRVIGWGKGANHTWNVFFCADRDTTTNAVLDMYSNNVRYFDVSDATASVKGCDIEHTLPNSWWGGKNGSKIAYQDVHLLVPADFSANRSKSNIPPGFVKTATFDNGMMRNGTPKQDSVIVYPADLKRVFEPADEYKGDFARMYFYTATRYGDAPWVMNVASNDARHAIDTASYLTFQQWLVNVLLSWHRIDPVSKKELARQEIIFQWQRNRNPFIDFPELVEYIWGNKKGENFHFSPTESILKEKDERNNSAK